MILLGIKNVNGSMPYTREGIPSSNSSSSMVMSTTFTTLTLAFSYLSLQGLDLVAITLSLGDC
jgi:hypothetical protein